MRKVLILTALVGLTAALATAASYRTAPGTEVFIPAAAHAPGAGGTFWKTDVRVYNSTSSDASVTAYELARDVDNSGAPMASFTVPAGGTVAYDDIYMTLFGHAEEEDVAGGFRFVSDQPIVVASRTFTPNDNGPGTYGQYIAGIPADNFIEAAASRADNFTDLLFVSDTTDFRSNIVMIDGCGGSTVTPTAYDSSGAMVGTQTFTLGAFEIKQMSIADLGWAGLSDGRITATVDSGCAAFGVSVVDNGSGDASWVDGTNAVAGGTTPPPPPPSGTLSGWYQGGMFYYDASDDSTWPDGWMEFYVDASARAPMVTDINAFYFIFQATTIYSWGYGVRGMATGNEDAIIDPMPLPDIGTGGQTDTTLKWTVESSTTPGNSCDYVQQWSFMDDSLMGWLFSLTETRVCKGDWSVLGGLNNEFGGSFGILGDGPAIWAY